MNSTNQPPESIATSTEPTVTTSLAPDKEDGVSSNVGIIAGATVGALSAIIILVIFLYFCCKRYRLRNKNDDNSDALCPKDNKNLSFVDELKSKARYIRTSSKSEQYKDSEGGYVSLSQNPAEEIPLYDNCPDRIDGSNEVDADSNRNMVREQKKPMPLPKPTTNLQHSKSSAANPVSRKPIPSPRPQTSMAVNDLTRSSIAREAENELYEVPEAQREAENSLYQPTQNDFDKSGETSASPPIKEAITLTNSKPCTSAQLFQSSHDNTCDDVGDKQFALYVPVGEKDAIYKIPSNVEKFDPPNLPPSQDNEYDDDYIKMDDDDYERPSNDYEDISNVTSSTNSYITMNAIPPDNSPTIYQNLPCKDVHSSDDEYTITM